MGTLSMPIDEAAETPKCSPGTSNTVSPFDISPVSNIKKRTTSSGRKATRSSLITGSPYKDQLTKSLEKSTPKKTFLSVPGLLTSCPSSLVNAVDTLTLEFESVVDTGKTGEQNVANCGKKETSYTLEKLAASHLQHSFIYSSPLGFLFDF
ncbi:hypothetical protein AVEN_230822-1 [Araneus ventricosus]|uniref:Uncharacterized protein n=1 Tax=Araneus ventricosus TaxID=182803 RepID=A0A4Y2A3C6_ARAVE|nr:hypothetical protein AVEN_230822-1 [Araneus ventricosus]